MKKHIVIFTLIISVIKINAQNEKDALRYSSQNLSGSARYTSMAGAFGALGGEFSALSSNPAGLGLYQISEFTFTPSLFLNKTKSYYNKSNFSDYKTGLNIGNLGLVFSVPKNQSEWKRLNIAIGWNQLDNYDSRINIQGNNNTSSIADNIVQLAQGNTIQELNNFHGSLAFWSDLIDLYDNSIDTLTNWYLNDNGNYVSNVNGSSNKTQRKELRSSGTNNELILSVGGSYNEQFYLGATIGFPTLNYYEISQHSEYAFEDTTNGLSSFDYNEELSVYGAGINIKLGAIYRINEKFKIGTYLHSPTLYRIEETYSSSINTRFTNESFLEQSPINYFEYELITPWKAGLSASSIINNNIIISGDYEIIDYSSSRMNSSIYNFNVENEAILDSYQKIENIKIGAEFNIKPFILRSGYSKFGSPIKNKDFETQNFSYGIGINNGAYYIDLAYILSQTKNEHNLYDISYIEPISLNKTNHSIVLTLGFRY